MPPHVLPDLKRNEPAVTPAVQRPACVLSSGGFSPSHVTYSQPAALSPRRKPKARRKKCAFELDLPRV